MFFTKLVTIGLIWTLVINGKIFGEIWPFLEKRVEGWGQKVLCVTIKTFVGCSQEWAVEWKENFVIGS